jgi:hypothetical protein
MPGLHAIGETEEHNLTRSPADFPMQKTADEREIHVASCGHRLDSYIASCDLWAPARARGDTVHKKCRANKQSLNAMFRRSMEFIDAC